MRRWVEAGQESLGALRFLAMTTALAASRHSGEADGGRDGPSEMEVGREKRRQAWPERYAAAVFFRAAR
jgi:hypothetical protein